MKIQTTNNIKKNKGEQIMQTWLCVNKQDKERRILIETEAFDLDKRAWDISIWNCTDTGEQPAKNVVAKIMKTLDFTRIGTKCSKCGAYHPLMANQVCMRPKHVRIS